MINRLLQVKARCSRSQANAGQVFFFLCLKLVNAFGKFSGAENQQSGGKRVKSSGVTNL